MKIHFPYNRTRLKLRTIKCYVKINELLRKHIVTLTWFTFNIGSFGVARKAEASKQGLLDF